MSSTEDSNKLIIHTDITDWRDETRRNGTDIKNVDDILSEIAAGKKTAEIVRSVIVSQEEGSMKRVTKPNKILLQVGAMGDISQIARAPKETIKTDDGKEYQAPKFVGQFHSGPSDSPSDEPSYVPLHSGEAVKIARRYLENNVVGMIHNRLVILYANNEDVVQAAENLKAKIDEMKNQLVASADV